MPKRQNAVETTAEVPQKKGKAGVAAKVDNKVPRKKTAKAEDAGEELGGNDGFMPGGFEKLSDAKKSGGEERVQKSPMQERFKKFLGEVSKELPGMVNEMNERVHTTEDGGKQHMVFATFSVDGEKDQELDNDYNKERIKDVLLHYHCNESKGAKAEVVEVLPPADADSPYILCYYQVERG